MGQRSSRPRSQDNGLAAGSKKARKEQAQRGKKSSLGALDPYQSLHLQNESIAKAIVVRPFDYEPLDRERDELRLLKILPTSRVIPSVGGLHLPQDIVQCELEHVPIGLFRASPAHAPNFKGPAELDRHWAGLHRADRDLLRSRFKAFCDRRKTWLPPFLRYQEKRQAWADWLQTWVSVPISDGLQERCDITHGYYALSYVWNDQQSMPGVSESDSSRIKFFQAGGQSYTNAIKSAGLESSFRDNVAFSKVLIAVNGTLVEVGSNLEKALRSLRDMPEIQNGRRVWVDSLCINQGDAREKAIEVMRMGHIFKTAERIISWIGEEKDGSGEALEAMYIVGQLGSITTDGAKQLAEWFFGTGYPTLRHSISQLMLRAYWSRIWITQELAMRNSKALILCGSRRVPTVVILQFGASMIQCAPALKIDGGECSDRMWESIGDHLLARSPKKGAEKLRDLNSLHTLDSSVRSGADAELWFRVASVNFATDPRDYVYSMLNILPPDIAAHITVDYTTSNTYQNVMTHLAAAHMASTRSLIWLLYTPWLPFHGQDVWPSWVPNLGMHFSSAHFSWITSQSDCNYGLRDTPDKSPIISYDHNDMPTLIVSGYFIDTILANTTNIINNQNTEHDRSLSSLLSSAESSALHAFISHKSSTLRARITFPDPPAAPNLHLSPSQNHTYTDHTGLKTALEQCFSRMGFHVQHARTSIFAVPLTYLEHRVQRLDHGTDIDQATAALLPPALPVLKDVLATFGDFQLWGKSLREFFTSGDDECEAFVPEVTIYERTALLARLFTTCGGYVGVALCPLRKGDRVAILPSCPMPVVLRPSGRVAGTAYGVVGSVFVPGLMRGEYWAGRGGDVSLGEEIMLV